MTRDPKARLSGVNACQLAADAIGSNYDEIHRCIDAYIRYAIRWATMSGGESVIPNVGLLYVRKRAARNRYNVTTKSVYRATYSRTVAFAASKQLEAAINEPETPRRSNARGISPDAMATICKSLEITPDELGAALRAWGHAAIDVIVATGACVIPSLGTIRVYIAEARYRHDVKSNTIRIRQQRVKVSLRIRPDVKALFR